MRVLVTVASAARVVLRCGAGVALAVWLAGCAAPEPLSRAELQAAAAAHQQWLESLSRWRATGRIAVDVPGDGWSASLLWRQDATGYRIQLSGPFGQGAVRIDGASDGVQLRTAEGRVARAPSAEALIAQELGVEVPVSVLRYWLLGRPAPGQPVARMDLDDAGRLLELEQAGWELRYGEYAEAESGGGALPARLDIRREGMHARFLVSRWQLGA